MIGLLFDIGVSPSKLFMTDSNQRTFLNELCSKVCDKTALSSEPRFEGSGWCIFISLE